MTATPDHTIFDRVWLSYQTRACFVCGDFGGCRHREYEVEKARIEADLRSVVLPRAVPAPKQIHRKMFA